MRQRGAPGRWARRAALAATALLLAASCGDGGGGEDPQQPAGGQLVAQVASYDVAVGSQRFIVGLLTADRRFVSGGTAELRFSFLGGAPAESGPPVTAEFLAIPGEEPAHEHPQAGGAAEGRGVYVAEDVSFDLAGPWQVEVTTEVDGRPLTAAAAFQVAEEHAVPAIGEEAPRTENLTLDDAGDTPPGAIDSRAEGGGEIPDPELHDTTIADAIRGGRPAVVAFATPVYCVSKFCGSIVDMIEGLRADHGDRAEFIHVEVWRDFQNRVVNKGAADWLFRGGNLQEPWVFFIDGDGVIRGRWDNVATRGEIEPFLEGLPLLD